MTARQLYLSGELRARLHSAQLDAIELACMDCSYEPIEPDDLEAALVDLGANPHAFLMVDVPTLIMLMESRGFAPSEQVIVVALDRENQGIAPHMELMAQVRYVIGAPLPILLRGVLAAILEYRIIGGVRGVLPRLLQLQTLEHTLYTLNNSSEKGGMQDKVTEFFTQVLAKHKETSVSGTSSYPKGLGDIVDEFLMNAIWDASPTREFADRTQATDLDEGEQVLIECDCDGQNLGLTVTDSHGTFPSRAFIRPIRYALGLKDDARVNEGPGGAGLGLYMILQKVVILCFEIERGKLTRAVAVLRLDQSLRDMQKKPKTVLFFEKH